jgi:uncharacterized membrane protein YedE/YeeE
MGKIVNVIIIKAGAALGVAAFSTAFICLMMAVLQVAGYFALGSECPPFPWFMLKFFLFIGWVVSALIGLFATGAKDHE